jgi:hypothetical protein
MTFLSQFASLAIAFRASARLQDAVSPAGRPPGLDSPKYWRRMVSSDAFFRAKALILATRDGLSRSKTRASLLVTMPTELTGMASGRLQPVLHSLSTSEFTGTKK